MDILEQIIATKQHEVEALRHQLPEQELYTFVHQVMEGRPIVPHHPLHAYTATCARTRTSMSQALQQSATGIIAEFKRKSPSKGWIHQDAAPQQVIPAYEQAGAAAVSVLTDEQYFGGSTQYLYSARPLVQIPLLRKEFIVHPYQVYGARLLGADAILLIAAALTLQTCRELSSLARQLGLEVLLEIHGQAELEYADSEPHLLGVNNRNLGTFHTDVANSFHLAPMLPTDVTWVSESGIDSPHTISALRQAGYRGFLMGEVFMRHQQPQQALSQLISQINPTSHANTTH